MRRHLPAILTVCVLATTLGIAIPVLAAGNNAHFGAPGDQACQTCAFICPPSAARLCDGQPVFVLVPAMPHPAPVPRGRIDPPDRGVCVTLPGQPCPRPPRAVR